MRRRQPAGEARRFALVTGAAVVCAIVVLVYGTVRAAELPAVDDYPDVDPRALIRSTFDDRDLYDAHPFDTSRPLVESSFDEGDRIDGHPVDTDTPLFESDFDRNDIVDRHPVSDEHPTGD